jgi:hypothetical protein
MTKTTKVKVRVSKYYYKTTEVEVDVPSHIKFADLQDYLDNLEDETSQFTDALAAASLNSEAGTFLLEPFGFPVESLQG